MPPKFKSPTEKTVCDLLDRYACPVPYHEVRTRFLGGIASPIIESSPLPIVEGLWGGEFPPFDSIEDLNELIDEVKICLPGHPLMAPAEVLRIIQSLFIISTYIQDDR